MKDIVDRKVMSIDLSMRWEENIGSGLKKPKERRVETAEKKKMNTAGPRAARPVGRYPSGQVIWKVIYKTCGDVRLTQSVRSSRSERAAVHSARKSCMK